MPVAGVLGLGQVEVVADLGPGLVVFAAAVADALAPVASHVTVVVAAALALVAKLGPGLVGVAAAVANALAPVPGLVEVAVTAGLGLEVAGADGPGFKVTGPAFRRSFFSSLRSSMGRRGGKRSHVVWPCLADAW